MSQSKTKPDGVHFRRRCKGISWYISDLPDMTRTILNEERKIRAFSFFLGSCQNLLSDFLLHENHHRCWGIIECIEEMSENRRRNIVWDIPDDGILRDS